MPNRSLLLNFCIAGINYRKSDVQVRGKFSISSDDSVKILKTASETFHGCFIVSTCNRTEIYGLCNDPGDLVTLLCKHTRGNSEDFIEQGYMMQGLNAVKHLFQVTAGLDSQIIGDYEILSQVKKAAQLSRENKCLNAFLEKVINFSLQASKAIKTNTLLSSGTVSVSYAAIEIIKNKIGKLADKKILVVGTGKFGHHVGKNLKTYLPECSLYFCNRTDHKALDLAKACTADFLPYDHLAMFADKADVIVVSSSAESFTILPSFFNQLKPRLILDLSIPQNVHPAVKNIEGVELMNVDEISLILEKTMSARTAEVPKAMRIINDTVSQFTEWISLQANSRLLKLVKSQLIILSQNSNRPNSHTQIHKTVSALALELREKNNKGCQCLHAISSYLEFNYEAAC